MIRSLLLFLLLAVPTVHYRMEFGGLSISLTEPFALLVTGLLIANQVVVGGRVTIRNDLLAFLPLGFLIWATFVRPFSMNQQSGISDVRDWLVPVLCLFAVSTFSRREWRKWMTISIVVGTALALLGIYQHVSDSFRPFVGDLASHKTGFQLTPDESKLLSASFAVAFFAHPNDFASYLFLSAMAAMGSLAKRDNRFLKVAVVFSLICALYLSYAKASLLVMLIAAGSFWLLRRLPYARTRFQMSAILVVLAGVVTLVSTALQTVPPALLATFWWRVDLWSNAIETIRRSPGILLWGNGMEAFASLAAYGQPHNLYLYSLLQYGLPGLTICLLLLTSIWRRGWWAWRGGHFSREPQLAAVWLVLLGHFGIGLVESNISGIEQRLIFLLTLACFAGLCPRASTIGVPSACRERDSNGGQTLARPVHI